MPQARLLYASRIHFASRKFNTFHGNSLSPTDTTNYSLFSHGFFETNPYAEIITKRTSNDRKITHPKSTSGKPGCKTLHPAAVQNERQRTKIYQSPCELKRNKENIITPVLKKSDLLSQILSKSMETHFGPQCNKTLEETIHRLAKDFELSRHGEKSILMQFHRHNNTNKLLWY